MNNLKLARQIAEVMINAVDGSTQDYDLDDIKLLITEVKDQLDLDESEFTIQTWLEGGECLVINKDDIDQIQIDRLGSDAYHLGCFYASYIADHSGLDIDLIKACQEREAFEALGKTLIKGDHHKAMAEGMPYGEEFSSYDGEEHETSTHYIFRTN